MKRKNYVIKKGDMVREVVKNVRGGEWEPAEDLIGETVEWASTPNGHFSDCWEVAVKS